MGKVRRFISWSTIKGIALVFSPFLLCVFVATAYPQGLMVMARKVTGELPAAPSGSVWSSTTAMEVPLAPQVMAKPRIYEGSVKKLSVRALHNGRDIAFLVEWDDRSEDVLISEDRFSDAVALQFPSASAQEKPHFAMGDKENTVNIWFWKAAWYAKVMGAKSYADADDFVGGRQAGNPISDRKSPIENIVAQGFGSATDMEKAAVQNVVGSSVWQSNRWAVVFKRTLASQNKLDVTFREGTVTPIAFAVWNGADGQRGGRKAVSTWYYVGLETEEKKTLFIYPILAFFVAVVLVAGAIIALRRARVKNSR